MRPIDVVMGELVWLKNQEVTEQVTIGHAYSIDGFSITQIAEELGYSRQRVRKYVAGLKRGPARVYDELSDLGRYSRARRKRNQNVVAARDLGVKAKDIAQLMGWTERHVHRIVQQEREKHG